MIVTTTLCLMLGHHLRLWINMNPALGHRSYWCAVAVSITHWTSIGLTLANCLRQRPKIRKTLGRCTPIVFTLWDWQWWIDVCQSSTTLAQHKINIDHVFRMYLLVYIIQLYRIVNTHGTCTDVGLYLARQYWQEHIMWGLNIHRMSGQVGHDI